MTSASGKFLANAALASRKDARDAESAARAVAASIDRWVWYAGWSDKIAQVLGGTNPAGPYFAFPVPEATRVVAIVGPQESSLLGLVSVLAPVIVTGCTALVLASETRPLAAINAVPGAGHLRRPGRSGHHPDRPHERARPRAGRPHGCQRHRPQRRDMVASLDRAAADNVKRDLPTSRRVDWSGDPGLDRIRAVVETKSVWHPIGI